MREFPCSDEQTAVRTWGPFGHLEETPLAARGNRLVGVGRLGVAFVATAAVALGQALPAFAEEAAPSASAEAAPAETATAETPSTTTATEHDRHSVRRPQTRRRTTLRRRSPSDTRDKARDAGGGHQAGEHRPAAESTPSSGTPSTAPRPDALPPRPRPPRASRQRCRKDAVKLEPAAPPAAPAAAAPATRRASARRARSGGAGKPHDHAPGRAGRAARAVRGGETPRPRRAATALIVSFRPRAGISLLPADEPAVKTVRSIRKAGRSASSSSGRTCARPAARVPLSRCCSQARAFAVLRATLHRLAQPGGAGRHRAGAPGSRAEASKHGRRRRRRPPRNTRWQRYDRPSPSATPVRASPTTASAARPDRLRRPACSRLQQPPCGCRCRSGSPASACPARVRTA